MTTSSPEQPLPNPETPKIESSGLIQTKQLINRYQTLVNSTQEPDTTRINNFLQKFGTASQSFVQPTDAMSPITTDHLVIRTDATNILLRQLASKGEAKFRYEPGSSEQRYWLGGEEAIAYERQTPEQRMETDLAELDAILQVQGYLSQVINDSSSRISYAPLQQQLDNIVDTYKGVAIKSLVRRGEELFTQDVLAENLPTLQDGLDPDKHMQASRLVETIKKILVIEKAPSELINNYQEPLLKLMKAQTVTFRNQTHTVADLVHFGNLDLHKYYLPHLTESLMKDMRQESWKSINIPPEQVGRLYDLLAPKLINTLFAGGRESWDGTSAVNTLSVLGDPRVLPHLIDHLRRFGAGHTSNSVAYAIQNIIRDPTDIDFLNKTIDQASPLHRRILNNWFRDSNTTVYKLVEHLEGYGLASLVQQAEQYLGRGDLLEIAVTIAHSQGLDISKETLEAYFFNNQFVDSSEVEDLLLQDLDTVAKAMAKSKYITEWKVASPRVFNALINPSDGDLARFPRIIVTEGLSSSPEEIDKINNLYKSGDLRRGAMARSIFAEGLLFLATKTEGQQIMSDILAASTGANRDPERMRDIFTLLRSLDSFDRFEFTKRESLTDIVSDLKGKLVTVIGEKMELTEAESVILNQRLFELMRTGLFDIIPQLLAKFSSQGRVEVVNIVREIGKHTVLDDFREWRNNLPTAIEQLAILTESERVGWLNPSSEVSIKVGINKESAQQGAIDAIARIASEAKAHILEIYKLDFSQGGINVLRARQHELIQQLKDGNVSIEEKRGLGINKREIDNQLRVIEGILGLENLTIDRLDPVQLNRYISAIINSLSSFPRLDQAASDLTQIGEVLATQKQIGTVTTIKSYDSDDPMALLKVGTEPRETCQSYRSGSFNHCLPAYVADANKRVINAENDKGEIVGRSVIKLTHIRDADYQTHPAILLEPIYTTSEITPIYQAVVQIALAKSRATGAYLVLTSDIATYTGANNEYSIPVAQKEATRANMQYSREDIGIFLPKSANAYEYSDSLGGEQSYFGSYHDLSQAIVIKP